MKLSLKVDDSHHRRQIQEKDHVPLLLRAKVPITVFGLPFLSGLAASDPSDISLSLRTNFVSGPSLKIAYNPTYTTAGNTPNSPLTVTLKSGVSLFGSPNNSPLIISANFAISPQNPNPSPTFLLQIKPQFGNFSLSKTTSSPPNPNPKDDATSMGFVPLERPMPWNDLTTRSSSFYKASLLSGIAVTAKTELPLTKRLAMNFRWGVNFPSDFGKQLPFLTVNKIGIEKIDVDVEVVKEGELKKSSEQRTAVDFELLKGVCLSMRREMEVLQKENREVQKIIQDTMFGNSQMQGWTYDGVRDGASKKAAAPLAGNSRDFEQRRTKKGNDQDSGRKESSKKNVSASSDLESEFQRAIKAASSQ